MERSLSFALVLVGHSALVFRKVRRSNIDKELYFTMFIADLSLKSSDDPSTNWRFVESTGHYMFIVHIIL